MTLKDAGHAFPNREWRPEEELILCCARGRLESASVALLEGLLRDPLDWDYVLRASEWHRLTPLLYRNLAGIGAGSVPQAILNRLQEETRRYTLANFVSREQLFRVLECLQEHQIPTVPLKGPALASYVYPEAWLRVPGDLDLLVRKQDVLKAKDLVISLGYQPELRLTPAQEQRMIRSQCEYNFNLDDPLTHLELHWRIVPPSFPITLDYEALWQRVEEKSLEGGRALNFRPEDLLLVLSIHGLKHCWERLKWLCDLAELIRACPGLDWDEVVDRANSMGAGRTLFLGLFLARDLLGAEFPDRFSETTASADKEVLSLAEKVCRELFREPYTRRSTFTKWGFRIRAAERPIDRLRQCFTCIRLTLTPHPADWETFPLPGPLRFAYFLLRPMRLMAKYCKASAKSFFSNPN